MQLQGGQTIHLVTGQKLGSGNVIRMMNPIGNQLVTGGGQVQLAQGGKLTLAGNQIIQVGSTVTGDLNKTVIPVQNSASEIKVCIFFIRFE